MHDHRFNTVRQRVNHLLWFTPVGRSLMTTTLNLEFETGIPWMFA